MFRKTVELLLGENEFSLSNDFKESAFGRNQLGFNIIFAFEVSR